MPWDLLLTVLGLQTCYCWELWSLEQYFMFCAMWVWFFIRKFLSCYWSMFRNTSCSYGNQWEFCPCLQTEQEQTPCLQHQTSWHKVRKLGGPAKLHWCGKVSLQIKRLQEKRAGCCPCRWEASPCLIPRKHPQICSLASSPCQPIPGAEGKRQRSSSISWLRCCWTHHSSEQHTGRRGTWISKSFELTSLFFK